MANTINALRAAAGDGWGKIDDPEKFLREDIRGENRPLTYLACPYSHADASVRLARFTSANLVAAILMARGAVVFSPITHSHPIALARNLPLGWDLWEKYDRAFLSVSRRVLVLTIDGWRESVGVQAEIRIAREMGIPVGYVNEFGDEILLEDLEVTPVMS